MTVVLLHQHRFQNILYLSRPFTVLNLSVLRRVYALNNKNLLECALQNFRARKILFKSEFLWLRNKQHVVVIKHETLNEM